MHIHYLDPYHPGTSPVHILDPRIKLVLALAYILTTALTPIAAWPIYILLYSIILSVEIISQLGVWPILKRAALALPFILAALPVIFTVGESSLFTIQIGSLNVTGYTEGFERFISVALKSWLSIQAAIVLAVSTSFPDLLKAMRFIHIPRLLVAIFGLMWRYLFVLVDEALRLMRARAARSGISPESEYKAGGKLTWRACVTGGMTGNLFLRAYERSDRIYMAMLSRGYDGEIRAQSVAPVNPVSWMMLGFGLFAMISLLFFGLIFWG